MKRVIKGIVWLAVLVAILYAGYRGMGFFQERNEAARGKTAAEKSTPGPVKVAVHTVQKGRVAEEVWVTGEVEPLAAVDVTPELSGRLERMRLPDGTLIEEGVEIEKGQVVAVIEHEQLQAAVQSAEAALVVSKANRGIAEVNLANARREKDRWVKLRKSGAGTEQRLDQAMTEFERAQAELKAAEAQVIQAGAALEQAKVDLADAMVKAPFSGVVSRKYVDEGAFVSHSTPLFKLVDVRRVEISGGVAGKHYSKLEAGKTRAEVEVDAYPGEAFSGTVTRVRPELDRVTRTAAVTIQASNQDRRLKPGMWARIRLVLREREDVLLVPDEALTAHEDGPRVFVVVNGTVHARSIRIGLEEGNLNEVLEGLSAGERVVVRGQRMVRDGMKVQAEEVDKV